MTDHENEDCVPKWEYERLRADLNAAENYISDRESEVERLREDKRNLGIAYERTIERERAEVERLLERVAWLESVIRQDGGAADWHAQRDEARDEVERLRARQNYWPEMNRLEREVERLRATLALSEERLRLEREAGEPLRNRYRLPDGRYTTDGEEYRRAWTDEA